MMCLPWHGLHPQHFPGLLSMVTLAEVDNPRPTRSCTPAVPGFANSCGAARCADILLDRILPCAALASVALLFAPLDLPFLLLVASLPADTSCITDQHVLSQHGSC
jgi:hypothetical protein